jgi:hypothetical protein
MNHRMIKAFSFVLILAMAVGVTSCKLLHEKVIDIVVHETASMEFEVRAISSLFAAPATVNVAAEVDSALADAGMSRDHIVDAGLIGATYEVTWFDDPGHDWDISGRILLSYGLAESTIVSYSDESLYDSFGAGEIKAELDRSGVRLFNQAIQDYINGGYPELAFTLANDTCTPAPTPADTMKFNWTGRIYMYVTVEQVAEVIDLF